MFLRNWDNMRTSLTFGANYSYLTNEDSGTEV
jgi:hypothetical protein